MADVTNNEFENIGFHWARKALSYSSIENLRNLTGHEKGPGKRIYNTRDINDELSQSEVFQDTLNSLLPNARAVRHIAFKKSNSVSWSLPWHQDRVISVKNNIDIDGYSNWSQKARAWHCEPPTDILKNMVFVQILLDDIYAENGAMKIAIGSHKFGRVTSDKMNQKISESDHLLVAGKAGDIIFLKALTLHRSMTQTVPSSRRTLRVDFFSGNLPKSLEFSI